ncbi:MAG: hypothetical protein JWM91_3631 [Rhodospirillales bacterium]|nr:hypothetical protein [Rhodospirillales bacterium]
MNSRAVRLVVLILALATVAGRVGAQTLTADLSSHVIGITTGFVGADLVLFGTTDRPGDIIVIVRGPPTDLTVRRKEKILGVWINGSSAVFHDAPSFYAVAASHPLVDIASQESMNRYGIGLENVKLQPSRPIPEPRLTEFRAALLSNQEKIDLYRRGVAPVTFLGEHLFRADMSFPANVPTGSYSVEVVLMSGGDVVSAQTTPLIVSRIGFSNGVFVVAHRHAVFYGLGALTFAIAAGWAAGAVFRRV